MPGRVQTQTQTRMHFRTHGGKRRGAGRPSTKPRPSERHLKRPRLRASDSAHVVLRAASDVGSLRTHAMYLAIRAATVTAATHEDFRIVHISIQRTHIHLICEAHNRLALANGIKAFAGSAAKHINRVVSARRSEPRRGAVFPDRYHARILSTPRQVRNCIAYVLNNWRHHREDELWFADRWLVDPYSSANAFTGWKEHGATRAACERPPGADVPPLVVWPPRTWLLSQGWLRYGRIGATEVPGTAAVE